MVAVQSFGRTITKVDEKEHIKERQQLLRDKKVQEYQKLVGERMQKSQAKVATATKTVMEKLKIPIQVWQKSSQMQQQNKAFQQRMQTYMKSMIEKERGEGDNQEAIEVLSREVTLKHVMTLESAKINLQK